MLVLKEPRGKRRWRRCLLSSLALCTIRFCPRRGRTIPRRGRTILSETRMVTLENPPGIQWVGDLPTDGRKRYAWGEDIAPLLKERPGKWALVGTAEDPKEMRQLRNRATTIRRGLTRVWKPRGEFDAVVRTQEGVTRLYACYVGPSDE